MVLKVNLTSPMGLEVDGQVIGAPALGRPQMRLALAFLVIERRRALSRHELPSLEAAEIDVHEPVRVGLRPFPHQKVRLEREPDKRIIHNYGHGGSGFTFFWGCAHEVVELAERVTEAVAA